MISYASQLGSDLGEDLDDGVRRLVLHLHQLVQLLGDPYPVHLHGGDTGLSWRGRRGVVGAEARLGAHLR